tara:strand:+ start:60 stop:209 length:150 start_codon:yes stop_codon:yes gene_type:complete
MKKFTKDQKHYRKKKQDIEKTLVKQATKITQQLLVIFTKASAKQHLTGL